MTYSALHLFSGLGGGALGFKQAGFEHVASIDHDEEACADHETIVGEEATRADLSELMPGELREICGECPDVVFTSPPCKSFSGCLPQKRAESDKYVELSSLAQRGIWLVLEAWPDSPPPLIVMENVPRIQSRGREWLDQTEKMLAAYGYASRETTHNCGELGGLAQHRRRFLMVARHTDQVPEFLYEPLTKRVRGVGEVLGSLPVPVPGSSEGGDLHRLPRLSAMNWVRLALIPAGGDWRDLPEQVMVGDGYRGRYGVIPYDAASPCIRGAHEARLAPASVADPRLSPRSSRHNGGYGVNDWDLGAHTVVGEGSIQNTWSSVADPRIDYAPRADSYGVLGYDEASRTIRGVQKYTNGASTIADPRVTCRRREGSLGVTGWQAPIVPVIGNATIHNHPCSVADQRCVEITHCVVETDDGLVVFGPELDVDATRKSADPVPVICAVDGTWHRPMTTLELAALQGIPVKRDGQWIELAGGSHKRYRQRIGNAVPPPAAEAVARSCMATLEAADNGDFLMDAHPVWVDRQEVRRD
ncbi:MAG: DNA cytosine methyltransferase [Trueperaceae bacterium]|nr:DNA cytosine methyltransferase [Trueperaceae bacterium]